MKQINFATQPVEPIEPDESHTDSGHGNPPPLSDKE